MTLQWILAAAFSLIFFVTLANIVFVVYTKGVLAASAAEAVHEGSRLAATPEMALDRCNSKIENTAGKAVGPTQRDQVQLFAAGRGGSSSNPCYLEVLDGSLRVKVDVSYCPHTWMPPKVTFCLPRISASAKSEYIGP